MDLIIKNNLAYFGDHVFPCTMGSHGVTLEKREGDGKTPIGEFAFRRVFYRADRVQKPDCDLPVSIITKDCGWCDDPSSPLYNKYITKPFTPSHEDLWLEKSLYNIIIVVGHNDAPAVPGLGSAIFIHLAHPDNTPTKGCIGLSEENIRQVLLLADTKTVLKVQHETFVTQKPH